MNKNKNFNNNILLPLLISGSSSEYEFFGKDENPEYLMDGDINEVKSTMYYLLIRWINAGLSYNEIIDQIDKINLNEFENLTNDKIEYIKKDAKKILTLRKRKEMIKDE